MVLIVHKVKYFLILESHIYYILYRDYIEISLLFNIIRIILHNIVHLNDIKCLNSYILILILCSD